jgi:hypothetical protein
MNKITTIINKNIFILLCNLAFAVFCIIAPGHATIVKTSHSNLLANATAAPSTTQEAYNKCVKDKEGEIRVNPSIEKISTQLEAFIKENSVPYGMENMNAGNIPQNMPTKEEIKKMTREEKMALVMKMQSQMNINTPPKNTGAWAKCIDLNNKFADLFSNDPLLTKISELDERYSVEHNNVNAETEAAVKTCPILSTGESSAPDFKCVKSKKLAGVEKHISVTSQQLGELRTILANHTNRIKGLITQLDQLMDEVKYGDGVDDVQSKTMLNQVQGLALQQIYQIQKFAQDTYIKSAEWIVEKQKIADMK